MHINLHKTFCIPHGGGGPGMGPIVCKRTLISISSWSCFSKENKSSISAVSSAPFGSASILPISYSYIKMMGADGLEKPLKLQF